MICWAWPAQKARLRRSLRFRVRIIEAMHDSDLDAWRAIDHGERRIDWEAFIGHPDGADYLTQDGKDLMSQAADDLTAFFGPDWLDRAMQPDGPRGSRIPQLAAASPVLALAPARRAGAYIETIRWWASLQILMKEAVPGYQAVRRDTRNNITAHRLLHTLAQARLAAMGLYQRADVAVEPGKAGGPGDVLWKSPHGQVFVEIATFGPDPACELEERHHDRHWMHLLVHADGQIWWDGYVPGLLNKVDEARWLDATAAAAARRRETGQPSEIPGLDGTSLYARPGRQPAGTGTFGPRSFSTLVPALTASSMRKEPRPRTLVLRGYGSKTTAERTRSTHSPACRLKQRFVPWQGSPVRRSLDVTTSLASFRLVTRHTAPRAAPR
jgi:hypothetical protein